MKILITFILNLISIVIIAQQKSIKNSISNKHKQVQIKLTVPIDSFTAVLYPTFGKEYSDDPSSVKVLSDECNLKFSFSKINSLSEGLCVFTFEDEGSLQTQEIKLNDDISYSKKCNGKNYFIVAKYINYFKNEELLIGSKVLIDFKIYEEKARPLKKAIIK